MDVELLSRKVNVSHLTMSTRLGLGKIRMKWVKRCIYKFVMIIRLLLLNRDATSRTLLHSMCVFESCIRVDTSRVRIDIQDAGNLDVLSDRADILRRLQSRHSEIIQHS